MKLRDAKKYPIVCYFAILIDEVLLLFIEMIFIPVALMLGEKLVLPIQTFHRSRSVFKDVNLTPALLFINFKSHFPRIHLGK